MPGVSIVVLAMLTGIMAQGPSPAAKALGTARAVALTLRKDAGEIAAAGGTSRGAGLTSAQRSSILNDISAALDTHRQLWETDNVASPSQDAAIMRIAPVLIDLTRNTEAMLDLERSDRNGLATRLEMAKQLAAQIIGVIDKCTDCRVKDQSGSEPAASAGRFR